eukprot:CAMPEP_0172472210 /NCGR_PEP_ID=MMETSP1065-20121228/68219_1 /TAXON_ID=265537 /ORGANISM="Amphiprora paludosa, Strain CCMP125" /LENGTH=407 /DNA_ID=CAMNT_0013230341 /DNA_START=301 /DNA_END=1524 /DNA_ORIENTATION=+
MSGMKDGSGQEFSINLGLPKTNNATSFLRNGSSPFSPLAHPHWGAKSENGQLGYVHDPQWHRTHPRPFRIDSKEEYDSVCARPGQGCEGPEGYQGLSQIEIAFSQNGTSMQQHNSLEQRPIRVFCAVYTFHKRVESTNAILETWGKRCDGLLFASTVSNVTTMHVHMPHQSRFEGAYKGMWQKVRAILSYLYDNFLKDHDYDYYHLCGDDTFLIIENLKAFLVSPSVTRHEQEENKPLFSGFWMHSPHWKENKKYPDDFYYLGGGSGYTLGRSALQQFVEKAIPICRPNKEAPQEDLLVSWCFKDILNVSGFDTRDASGAHRYHQLPVDRYMLFPHKKKFGISTFLFKSAMEFMQKEHGFPLLWGSDYLSNSSISFHMLKSPFDLKRYEVLLYGDGEAQKACNYFQP